MFQTVRSPKNTSPNNASQQCWASQQC